MYSRLANLINKKDDEDDLPEFIDVTQEELDSYYLIWAWWMVTGRKHLISDILNEPYEPMAVVLEIDRIYGKISKQLSEDESEEFDG